MKSAKVNTEDKTSVEIEDFLQDKSPETVALYHQLVIQFAKIGEVNAHAAKSMICFSATRNFAYVIQLGRNFLDLVLPFKDAYEENLCFRKIKAVPGSDDFNHHLRIYGIADFNEEVIGYLEKAYQLAKQSH